jgi:hypothetical protein
MVGGLRALYKDGLLWLQGSCGGLLLWVMIIIITNMLMPVQENRFMRLRVLVVLTDRSILA